MLEVGCGAGELAGWLAGGGYAVTGIDPEAPAGDGFVRTELESFATEVPFDAAVASRSLHHLHDLDAALARLRDALAPQGHLVVYEFASEALGDEAQRWLAEAGLAYRRPPGVIPVAELRSALARDFRELVAEPVAYIARELGRDHLHEREAAAIAAGELEPTGWRLAYERRP